jgi:hypothetical protein
MALRLVLALGLPLLNAIPLISNVSVGTNSRCIAGSVARIRLQYTGVSPGCGKALPAGVSPGVSVGRTWSWTDPRLGVTTRHYRIHLPSTCASLRRTRDPCHVIPAAGAAWCSMRTARSDVSSGMLHVAPHVLAGTLRPRRLGSFSTFTAGEAR